MANETAAELANLPDEFEFEGRTWKISSSDTVGVVGELERWIANYARECINILRPRENFGEEERWLYYRESIESYETRLQSGFYKFGGEGFYLLTNSPEGLKQMIYRATRFNSADWTWDMTKRLWDDLAKRNEVLNKLTELSAPKTKATTTPPPAVK